MTFDEFVSLYDFPGSIVLLEGKREVQEPHKEMLVALGVKLAGNTKHILFRSGNADGADHCFSSGVKQVNLERLQVINLYTGHRQSSNQAYSSISLDDINLLEKPEVVYQSKSNKKTEKLIGPFVEGNNNAITVKAAYIIRDTIKVIGTRSGIALSNVALFYDDQQNPQAGGTGHTMKICEANAVPFYDQRIWMGWLE